MILLLSLTTAHAFETSEVDHLELKWFRDSIEFQALTTGTFRNGLAAVEARSVKLNKKKTDWTVVVDIDETLLDNSPYFLELAAYHRLFDWASWDAWCERRTAEPIAGAPEFIAGVREAGGRVAFISNRMVGTQQATIDNLKLHGMWSDDDLICLKTDDKAYSKIARRAEVAAGKGECSWDGVSPVAVAYFGDTITDFPSVDEGGDPADHWGVDYFVLPNPMYGGWEHGVTRPDLLPAP